VCNSCDGEKKDEDDMAADNDAMPLDEVTALHSLFAFRLSFCVSVDIIHHSQ